MIMSTVTSMTNAPPSEGSGSVPKLVTGEDAVLITAGVVGSVVDVGTR